MSGKYKSIAPSHIKLSWQSWNENSDPRLSYIFPQYLPLCGTDGIFIPFGKKDENKEKKGG